MAKHNLFLGTGSGSVGDVVVMRREGVQVQRVRVRKIANPKTYGQAEQRNFLAPVAKFFAPLAGALEKGWEGLNKSKSYIAFLKKNIDMARTEGYWLDKGTPFFPLPYYLTMGTLPPIFVEVNTDDNIIALDGLDWTDDTVANLSNAMANYAQDVLSGDQITLIAVVKNGESYVPIWERFFIDFSNSAATSTILKQFKRPNVGSGESAFGFEVAHPQDGLVACAVIHSRWSNGKWRRSPQRLIVSEEISELITSNESKASAIASYRDSSGANPSDVYLNGQVTEDLFPFTVYPSHSTSPVKVGPLEVMTVDPGGQYETEMLVAKDKNGNIYYFTNDTTGAETKNYALNEAGQFRVSYRMVFNLTDDCKAAADGTDAVKANYDYLIGQEIAPSEFNT